jgi:hypothetical protein
MHTYMHMYIHIYTHKHTNIQVDFSLITDETDKLFQIKEEDQQVHVCMYACIYVSPFQISEELQLFVCGWSISLKRKEILCS